MLGFKRKKCVRSRDLDVRNRVGGTRRLDVISQGSVQHHKRSSIPEQKKRATPAQGTITVNVTVPELVTVCVCGGGFVPPPPPPLPPQPTATPSNTDRVTIAISQTCR